MLTWVVKLSIRSKYPYFREQIQGHFSNFTGLQIEAIDEFAYNSKSLTIKHDATYCEFGYLNAIFMHK